MMLYGTGSIPELAAEPIRILLHIAAELATGIALIVSGVGLWRCRPWAKELYWLATGALLYTLIQSPGYYAQLGQWPMVILFALLFIVSVILLLAADKRSRT